MQLFCYLDHQAYYLMIESSSAPLLWLGSSLLASERGIILILSSSTINKKLEMFEFILSLELVLARSLFLRGSFFVNVEFFVKGK